MRIPSEDNPIRSESDLDTFEMINVMSFALDHKFSKKEIGTLMLAFRIYAGAYHELVLTGRCEAVDLEKLCEKAGVDHKTIREARLLTTEMCAKAGLLKENDKGGFDYVNSKFRKGH